jgi:DNA ligase-associated metallophosphoesterase
MFWENKQALVVADLHLGKITHFRKSGIAVPASVEIENYERLSTLILEHKPKSVLILGDLFHSDHNSQWSVFEGFINKFTVIQFHLIMGNHDILNSTNYAHENLSVHNEVLKWGNIAMTHHPTFFEDYYNLCGHIHPGVKIIGKGKQSMRLPCFYFSPNQCVLPAFGAFTGLFVMDVKQTDEIYGIIENEVVPLRIND